MDNPSSKKDVLVSELAFVHYESLRKFLASYLQQQKQKNLPSTQRASAREKLMKLTKTQFAELSTDVYDEMNRRITNSAEVPFLPVRDEFHPKRNQARQKLATLPSQRCKDLASDVYYEIERRFPIVITQYIARHGDNDGTLPASFDGLAKAGPLVERSPSNASTSSKNVPAASYSPVPLPVNFGNLDNLVSDLNSSGLNGRRSIAENPPQYALSQTDLIEKIKSDYEGRLREMEGKLGRMDEQNLQLQANISQLSGINSRQKQTISDLEAMNATLKQDFEKYREDFESLQDDYTSQQHIANEIRSEATALLDEIKRISQKNDELAEENKNLANMVKELTSRQSRISYGNSPDFASLSRGIEDKNEEEDGVIDERRIEAYQNAVDDLLQSSQSENSASVLVAMKSIVVACKAITEDTEHYEATKALSQLDRERLLSVKSRISVALTDLMGSAKLHATNFGRLPPSSGTPPLQVGATALTASIVDLVSVLKIKHTNNRNSDRKSTNVDYSNGFDLYQLKTFLEKQTDLIVQGIQSLLLIMRNHTSKEPYGDDFKSMVQEICGIVENVVLQSRQALARPEADRVRDKGQEIVADLAASNSKLEELNGDILNMPEKRKILKQKLASSSYEIAKFVKELISLIE